MTNEQSAKEHLALVRPTVMVVDDTPQNLALMTELLRDDYRVVVANSGERALKLLQAGGNPDLILLDIMMPGMDGYEVITRLKADEKTRDIPVMFLTAKSEVEDETHGLELGAVDYIIKPISPPIVMARVRTHLALKASADFLRDKAQYLESEVAKRTRQVEAIQDVTVLAMSSMAETRDNETGNHILRTQRYIKRLAEQLRDHPNFRQELTEDYIKQLFKSAPLHDIGKVGIPDHILLKPGKLTPQEFEIMKTHTTIGYESIMRAERPWGWSWTFCALRRKLPCLTRKSGTALATRSLCREPPSPHRRASWPWQTSTMHSSANASTSHPSPMSRRWESCVRVEAPTSILMFWMPSCPFTKISERSPPATRTKKQI